jgi:hypothetical protein
MSGNPSSNNTIRFSKIDKGIVVLTQEINVLNKIIDIQSEMRASVIIREWEDFDELMQNLNMYNSEFEKLEHERSRIFSMMLDRRDLDRSALDRSENEEESLYKFAARLPDEQRHALTDLYRELKMRIIRVRYENGTLLKYLNEARAFAENFLADVIPNRRGKLYSAKGTIVASDMRSMMINKSL